VEIMKSLSLEDLHGPSKQGSDEINYKICPVCGNDNWHLYVNETTGKWYCHAGEHGAGGKIVGVAAAPDALLEQLELELDPPAQKPWDWPEIQVTKLVRPDTLIPCHFDKDIRCGNVFYSYNDSGQLIHFINYYEPGVYGNMKGNHPLYVPNWVRCVRPVIVEGPWDAMRLSYAGYRAIALLGKKLPARLQADLLYAVGGHRRPVVMLDGDAVAEAQLLARWLELQPGIDAVDVIMLPDGMDPGDLTNEEVRNWIE
jgi:hypothetical protein